MENIGPIFSALKLRFEIVKKVGPFNGEGGGQS